MVNFLFLQCWILWQSLHSRNIMLKCGSCSNGTVSAKQNSCVYAVWKKYGSKIEIWSRNASILLGFWRAWRRWEAESASAPTTPSSSKSDTYWSHPAPNFDLVIIPKHRSNFSFLCSHAIFYFSPSRILASRREFPNGQLHHRSHLRHPAPLRVLVHHERSRDMRRLPTDAFFLPVDDYFRDAVYLR